jgi:ABC-type phosphate transport system substrate-binding protein
MFCLMLVSWQSVATAFVVVVNKNNPIESLSKREVIDIYMGRFLTFPGGEHLQPLDLPSQSSLKNDFYVSLVNQDERKIKAYWARLLFSGRAKPPETVDSIAAILAKVEEINQAIAYIPAAAVTDNVKVVYRLDEN